MCDNYTVFLVSGFWFLVFLEESAVLLYFWTSGLLYFCISAFPFSRSVPPYLDPISPYSIVLASPVPTQARLHNLKVRSSLVLSFSPFLVPWAHWSSGDDLFSHRLDSSEY
jgi:hypothetical protein